MQKLINAVARQVGSKAELKEIARDVANHGASGGYSGFIYTTDVVAFFKKHRALIIQEAKDSESLDYLVDALVKNLGDEADKHTVYESLYGKKIDNEVANFFAWYALETVCQYLTND